MCSDAVHEHTLSQPILLYSSRQTNCVCCTVHVHAGAVCLYSLDPTKHVIVAVHTLTKWLFVSDSGGIDKLIGALVFKCGGMCEGGVQY